MIDDEHLDFIDRSPPRHTAPREIYLKLTYITLTVTMFLTLLLIALKILEIFVLSWTQVGIVIAVCFVIIMIWCNLWICKIFIKYDHQDFLHYPYLVKLILAISTNSSTILLPIFILLVFMKVDGEIDSPAILLMLPFFLLQVILMLFLCFIIPGLVDEENGYKKWIWVLMSYYGAFWLCDLLFLVQIHQFSWVWVVLPLLLAIVINIFVVMPGWCRKHDFLNKSWTIIVLLVLAYTLIIFALLLDQEEATLKMKYLTIVPILIASLVLTLISIL